MVPEPISLPLDMQTLGLPRPGSDGNLSQHKVQAVSGQGKVPRSGSNRCPQYQMGLQTSLCVPSDCTNLQITQQNKNALRDGDSNNSNVVTQAVVPIVAIFRGGTSNTPSEHTEPTTTRPSGTCRPRSSTFSSLEAERKRLKEAGCSAAVVETLLKTRTATTNQTYSRIWKKIHILRGRTRVRSSGTIRTPGSELPPNRS